MKSKLFISGSNRKDQIIKRIFIIQMLFISIILPLLFIIKVSHSSAKEDLKSNTDNVEFRSDKNVTAKLKLSVKMKDEDETTSENVQNQTFLILI